MLVIEIKSKIKAGSDYVYGINLYSIYNYVVALLNQQEIEQGIKFSKEHYNVKFALIIKEARKFGNKFNYYTNKTTDRAVGSKDKKYLYSTILDNPRMFVHLNIILKDKQKLEESLNIKIDWDDKSSILLANKKIKQIPFLGNRPSSVYLKQIDDLKQIGGRVVYEEKFENVDEFLSILDRGKENEVFYPTILGYQKIQKLNFKTAKNKNEFNSCLIEPLIGLVGLKSVYKLDEINNKNYWFQWKNDENMSVITSLENNNETNKQEEILI